MSLEIPNSFSRFRMSDQEAVAAAVLTVMQKQHIHNLRVDCAETMLNIEDDVDQPLLHVKERARLRGLLDAYAALIALSEAAEQRLAQLDSNER